LGDVTHKTKPLEVSIEGHKSTIIFNIIKTPSNPIILGFFWLQKYNPMIDWRSPNLLFSLETFSTEFFPEPSIVKPILVGARPFIKAIKKGNPYIIYTTQVHEKNDTSSSI